MGIITRWLKRATLVGNITTVAEACHTLGIITRWLKRATRSEIELRLLKHATRSEIQVRWLEPVTRIGHILVVAVKVYVN